jgi:hypothetical protein
MIDLEYIFNKTVVLLKKETKFFTSSELHLTIGVDSFRRIASDLEYPKSNYSSVVLSGTWAVLVPSDFIRVDKTNDLVFKDSEGIHKLTSRTRKAIGRDEILSAAPSVPSNYFMEDQKTIGIYPPSTSGTIVVPYVQRPTSLSSDSDTNELTEKCYMASVYFTLAQCMMKDNDQRLTLYEVKYKEEIKRLRGEYDEMMEEEEFLSPSTEYLRR